MTSALAIETAEQFRVWNMIVTNKMLKRECQGKFDCERN